MKKIICFLFGHLKVQGLFEDDHWISNQGCSRCGRPIWSGGMLSKKVREHPPRWQSHEYWDKYCDTVEQEYREVFKKK